MIVFKITLGKDEALLTLSEFQEALENIATNYKKHFFEFACEEISKDDYQSELKRMDESDRELMEKLNRKK